MDDKIIVTNRSALQAKYGAPGLDAVKRAVAALVAADGQRGIASRLLFLDDATAMKRLRAKAVTDRKDAQQNKDAIDGIFRALAPEYLLILGSVDVVPHQDIRNPMFVAGDDDDPIAFGDLPYACDAPYSRDPAAFKAPSRVVGRLPDLTGARDPKYIVALLATAAGYQPRPVTDYGAYFGLSTASWQKSTAMSLFNTFGNSTTLQLAPPRGPKFTAQQLAPLTHFINCHGGPADPTFYGEEDKPRNPAQPPSLTSDAIAGKIKHGTVAAVECCYGAELYDSVTLALPLPICQRYLAQGAYGYFGSSTIAYGPAEGNGSADLITQYFLLSVLDGASLGRAALIARQKFVAQTGELDAADLKTLAQFNLLGDPSLHPAAVESATAVPKGVDAAAANRQMRKARRAKLREAAAFLEFTKPTASRPAKASRKSAGVQQALKNIAREAGLADPKTFTAFDVKMPAGLRGRRGKAAGIASRYFVAVFRRKAATGNKQFIGPRAVAVAKEVDGRIVGYRIYQEK